MKLIGRSQSVTTTPPDMPEGKDITKHNLHSWKDIETELMPHAAKGTMTFALFIIPL